MLLQKKKRSTQLSHHRTQQTMVSKAGQSGRIWAKRPASQKLGPPKLLSRAFHPSVTSWPPLLRSRRAPLARRMGIGRAPWSPSSATPPDHPYPRDTATSPTYIWISARQHSTSSPGKVLPRHRSRSLSSNVPLAPRRFEALTPTSTPRPASAPLGFCPSHPPGAP